MSQAPRNDRPTRRRIYRQRQTIPPISQHKFPTPSTVLLHQRYSVRLSYLLINKPHADEHLRSKSQTLWRSKTQDLITISFYPIRDFPGRRSPPPSSASSKIRRFQTRSRTARRKVSTTTAPACCIFPLTSAAGLLARSASISCMSTLRAVVFHLAPLKNLAPTPLSCPTPGSNYPRTCMLYGRRSSLISRAPLRFLSPHAHLANSNRISIPCRFHPHDFAALATTTHFPRDHQCGRTHLASDRMCVEKACFPSRFNSKSNVRAFPPPESDQVPTSLIHNHQLSDRAKWLAPTPPLELPFRILPQLHLPRVSTRTFFSLPRKTPLRVRRRQIVIWRVFNTSSDVNMRERSTAARADPDVAVHFNIGFGFPGMRSRPASGGNQPTTGVDSS